MLFLMLKKKDRELLGEQFTWKNHVDKLIKILK